MHAYNSSLSVITCFPLVFMRPKLMFGRNNMLLLSFGVGGIYFMSTSLYFELLIVLNKTSCSEKLQIRESTVLCAIVRQL